MKKALALLLLIPVAAFSKEKLIFALDIIRHGDRAPQKEFPADPIQWERGAGELTDRGIRQEYALGEKFRRRYILENGLLSGVCNPNEMHIETTHYHRTLESAQSVLRGLYPQKDDKSLYCGDKHHFPITQHIEGPDFLVTISMPDSEKILNKSLENNPLFIEMTNRYKPDFSKWSAATGITINAIPTTIGVGDTLYIRKEHGRHLPPGLSKDDVNHLMMLRTWGATQMHKIPAYTCYNSLGLIEKIYDHMQVHEENTSKLPKWVLYSAHDSTIESVLGAMGAPLEGIPYYASDLNFSLYEVEKEVFVTKVTLNNRPVNFPMCRNTNLCTTTDLKKMINRCRELNSLT